MSLIEPSTLSPGYIVLKYGNVGRIHRTGLRLAHGVDLEDVSTLATVCQNWSTALKAVIPSSLAVLGWELHDPDHIRLYENDWSSPYVGTHTTVLEGNAAYLSRTVAFTGRGVGASVFNQTGQWSGRIFVHNAYYWQGGQRFVSKDVDSAMADLWAFYDECLVGPADFYGQHVEVRKNLPVQHNSFAQNHWGE